MKYLYPLIFASFFAISCSGETEQQEQVVDGEGVQIESAWARPASEGRMSAAYFLITNFENSEDALIGVESDVAQMVEVHESYEREEGMMGMREVPEVELPSESTVRFQQGGLHIMLIQVTRTLADGDTFELTLNFSNSESQTIEVPVRL
ncbi:copper chaperone PCu(A)C [Rhodohalobacter sp.]|uniref:copper chaperone PCu(A)C n=1 Tax=Rhodohalobacter sp. TaxID=1974210 RepID=UPI003565B71E